jgi:dynein light chain LC8-type
LVCFLPAQRPFHTFDQFYTAKARLVLSKMSEGSSAPATSADTSSGDFRNLFGARVLQPLDMDEAQLRFAIEFTREQLKACDDWQAKGDAVVDSLKQEFDRRYGPSWHCIIGKHFGSKVTHDSRQFCFFYVEVSERNAALTLLRASTCPFNGSFNFWFLQDKAVLLFKAG